MKQAEVHNLNFSVNDSLSIKNVEFNPEKNAFYCSINFHDIVSAEFLEGLVLVIKFRDGEIRFDIPRSRLAELLTVKEKNR